MQQHIEIQERRTSADIVFDYLYEQIGSLELLPGTKISEADIAAKFGISRQPVRDAFSRLGNLDLLLIRPQKATEVRKFSLTGIAAARFVRLSVELEVLRKAGAAWDGSRLGEFQDNLARQHDAFARADVEAFHARDYEFHRLLCDLAGVAFAFEIIAKNKAQVDRLCVLSLTAKDGMRQLIEDHELLLDQLVAGDVDGLCSTIRVHLSRLDDTIDAIHSAHASYFDT
ncbi:MAG: GntR family transcriptional regulator [Pseudomonadota bacterium]